MPDLDCLADELATSRFDRGECFTRLTELDRVDDGERRPYTKAARERAGRSVEAIGAARRLEELDAATARRVLVALDAEGFGDSSRHPSLIFEALFGARGRNSLFSLTPAISWLCPVELKTKDDWHDYVIAFETDDADAHRRLVSRLPDFTRMAVDPGMRVEVWWELHKRIAGLEELDEQVRWVLDGCVHRAPIARAAARDLARELGLRVPQYATVRDYSVAPVLALAARLPEDGVEKVDRDALFELALTELKKSHVGTTISECLAVIPWQAVADEVEGDKVTVRRQFRGFEVTWTAGLDRFQIERGRLNDLKGRFSFRRARRALRPGRPWAAQLPASRRDQLSILACRLRDVFALHELIKAGAEVGRAHVRKARDNDNLLRLLAPHLSDDERRRVLTTTERDGVALAMLDHVEPTLAEAARFAELGATEVIEAMLPKLDAEGKAAALEAASRAEREATAAALRASLGA